MIDINTSKKYDKCMQGAQMKNAAIKFIAHDRFLEQLSSRMLTIERLKKIKVLGASRSKDPNKIVKGHLRSHKSEGREP